MHLVGKHPTEQKILDEAIRIIDERGEAGVRIQDIQIACEVTPPSIYHFFGSREGLVCEAQAARLYRSFAEMDGALDGILSNIDSRAALRDGIAEYIRTIFDTSRSVERLRRVATIGSVEGRPELSRRFNEVIEGYVTERVGRLAVLQDRGYVAADLDLSAFTYWIMALIFGRTLIELGSSPEPQPAWDAIAFKAISTVLLPDA
jgi:AcrR family transcriptional regulator